MKNIFLIPTPDESRIAVKSDGFLFLTNHPYPNSPKFANHHIYITKNEDIKEGVEQWYLDKVLNEPYNSGGAQYSSKQDVIVLTDDKKLIADGVQPIPEDFLEWFVDNQTCETIEVVYEPKNYLDVKEGWEYTTIIPKQLEEYCHYSGLPSPAAYMEKPNEEELRKIFSNAFNIPQEYHGLKDKPNVIVVGSGVPLPRLTLDLTQKEARGLLNCLIRTHANGTDLDVGEAIEEKLLEFLKPLEKNETRETNT
jgi:hypothetical protein